MNVEELANVLTKVQDNYYHKCKVQEVRIEDDYHFTLVVEAPHEDNPIEKKYDTFARTEYSIEKPEEKEKETHKVIFEYPVPGGGMMGIDPELDSLAESLGEAHNYSDGGRGSGFGVRDFDFYFTSSHDAKGMVESLEGSGQFIGISLFELDENGEIVED